MKNLLCALLNLVPWKWEFVYIDENREYRQILSVETMWLGFTLKKKEYVLADSKERHWYLRELVKNGCMSEEECKTACRGNGRQ